MKKGTRKYIIEACEKYNHEERTYIISLTNNSYHVCKNCSNYIRNM